MIVMKVARLSVDPLTSLPLLVLTDDAGTVSVPISIGVIEASAIASELANIELQRPMAHDLMKTILGECGATVDRVELRDVRHDTYYASIFLQCAHARRGKPARRPAREQVVEIDARPSDAIALALRTGAPIWVAEKVIGKARRLHPKGSEPMDPMTGELAFDPDDPLGFPLLESLTDEDFGKWKM